MIKAAIRDENLRMADYCIEQFKSYARGEKPIYTIDLDGLERMA